MINFDNSGLPDGFMVYHDPSKKQFFLAEQIALPSCSFQEVQNSASDSTLKLSHTVDGSEILNNHSLDVKKNVVNSRINYQQPQLVIAGFLTHQQ